jgi:hypothetical protein
MKELKICRRCKNKFTVVIGFEDYGGFAYDGLFPVIYICIIDLIVKRNYSMNSIKKI